MDQVDISVEPQKTLFFYSLKKGETATGKKNLSPNTKFKLWHNVGPWETTAVSLFSLKGQLETCLRPHRDYASNSREMGQYFVWDGISLLPNKYTGNRGTAKVV